MVLMVDIILLMKVVDETTVPNEPHVNKLDNGMI